MDAQLLTIILFIMQALMGIIGGAGMWWINTTWNKVANVERQLHLFEVKVAGDYVSNAELERIMRPIMDRLDHISNRIDENLAK